MEGCDKKHVSTLTASVISTCPTSYTHHARNVAVSTSSDLLFSAVLQDIVTAHEHFNMDDFVGQFQTALQVTSPKKRMFLLDWMGVSMPLLVYS